MIGLLENMTEGAGLLVGMEVHHVQELCHLMKERKKWGEECIRKRRKIRGIFVETIKTPISRYFYLSFQ